MNEKPEKVWFLNWFPARRFESDFPLVFWFAGLWLLLKAFLYLCNVYTIGLEPSPYLTSVRIELVYFGAACIVSLLLGLGLWNEKKWAARPAASFLILDTPMLLFHIINLSEGGFLDSGITVALEFGSLALNLISLVWLIARRTQEAARLR